MKLAAIRRYPLKSMGGNTLEASAIGAQGFPGDREWLLTAPDGTMLTARKLPQMLLWHAQSDGQGLTLTAPDGSRRSIAKAEMAQPSAVAVWKDRFEAWSGSGETDEWLSTHLGTAARLHYLGGASQRVLAHTQTPLSFADGAPYLLTHTASLDELNRALGEPVEMARFRANLVVEGGQPFAEESWRRIRIGGVEFEYLKPCVRCVMTTVDLQSGRRHPQQEPLSTLAVMNKAVFGINLVALCGGTVRLGDEVEVLA